MERICDDFNRINPPLPETLGRAKNLLLQKEIVIPCTTECLHWIKILQAVVRSQNPMQQSRFRIQTGY
jgi:hypothetical protein